MGMLPLEEHDGIAQLQRVFNRGLRKDGVYGTGVTVQEVDPEDDLNQLAMDAVRKYLGKYWGMVGSELLTNWHQTITILPYQAPWREPLENMLYESGDDNLECCCDMLTEYWEDPSAARRALDGAFNCQDVDEMAVYSMDDGGIHYGMVIAARMKNAKAVALVAVFGDLGY